MSFPRVALSDVKSPFRCAKMWEASENTELVPKYLKVGPSIVVIGKWKPPSQDDLVGAIGLEGSTPSIGMVSSVRIDPGIENCCRERCASASCRCKDSAALRREEI